ncbi:MAG: aspartate aminotransferase family protein [Candidatus Latescibacteria bacterium]|jgi:glutamate-1-semialdehyde 2,1-aminomutase|nr:aspartate aminotransferase family protein [Candidatus Latescibacterota bacterium]
MPLTPDQLVAEYRDQNAKSQQLFRRAQDSLPGGNTRTGVYVDPFPIYTDQGAGVYVTDVDGNKRLDFVNNATALVLGHTHPNVANALKERISQGTAFFGPTALEIEWAELLRERVPSLERLRFCSSGTEAVMNVLRVARAFTGRGKIAKFEGAYHGIDDPALISYVPPVTDALGEEETPSSVISSAGLAPSTAENVVVLPFNNAQACARLIDQNKEELAAVIIDPLSTAAGLALPDAEFLNTLRAVTEQHGILLIFDEIVSFRMSSGGTQQVYGITPDLTCLAKVIAGGTPAGAFGGRADVMALYDPIKGAAIPQSGTYNGNPLVAVAGLATLQTMTAEAYNHVDTLAQHIAEGLDGVFREADVTATVVVTGSLFRIYFLDTPPRNYREAAQDDKEKHKWLNFYLLNQGIVTRQGGCTSLPMTTEHADTLIKTVGEGVKVWAFS